jgi:bifunctional UDP-N-acetylglucosamine pyrophosphorylase/glucosamine-1-phosphate N-acetyltransferase
MTVLILAVGKGKRMKSDLTKVLHLLGGRPLVRYIVDHVWAEGFLKMSRESANA